jgi:hypothetical protein
MANPVPIGSFHDYGSFVALLRQRKERLGLSNEALDELAGFTRGHVDKLLGPVPVKGIGAVTFGPLLDALGLSGTLFADPAKAARLAGRWEKRKAALVRDKGRIGKAAVARVRPGVLAELAAKGAAARWAGMTPADRARHVAKMNSARRAKRLAGMTR